MLVFNRFFSLTLIVFSLLLSACGSDGDNDNASSSVSDASLSSDVSPAPDPQIFSGRFIDSAVSGLQYKTKSLLGKTNRDGKFHYREGEIVEFSIGDVVIGSAEGKSIITPLDISKSENSQLTDTVINIVRLLTSLDSDGDPENGISIEDKVHREFDGWLIDFSLTEQLFENDQALLESLDDLGATLTTAAFAKQHFEATLEALDVDYTNVDNQVPAPDDGSGSVTDEPLFTKADNSIIAVIEVGNTSLENITIDYAEHSAGTIELHHEISFDTTNDGVVGVGDLMFSLLESKQEEGIERIIEFSEMDASLLYCNEVRAGIKFYQKLASIEFEVIDNKLIFTASKNLSIELQKINSQTQVSVRSYFYRLSEKSGDYLPQIDTYTQEQDNSLINDVVGDHYGYDYADIKKFELFITN